MNQKIKTALSVAACSGTAFVVGCASTLPPPNDQWAAAQADVGRAQEAGASNVPDARLHLQLSQEDLQKAKQLIDQDNKQAANLTVLASVEAQLALSLAKQASAQDRAVKAQAELQAPAAAPPR
jgi:hypothetical protein